MCAGAHVRCARVRASVCDARLRAHLRTMQDEQAEAARVEAARLDEARLEAARLEEEARQCRQWLEETRLAEARLAEARVNAARLEEEARECVICMVGAKTHTLVPCGHKCLCEGCSQDLMTNRDPCPICRGPPDSCIRVFDV